MEIMYHPDHIEYEINGLEVHKATPEEINVFEKLRKRKEAKIKLEEITQLKEQLAQLERELNNLR